MAELNDPEITFKPLQAVRELQGRLLHETVEICYHSHPFYARMMRREGLKPGDIRSVDDLQKLPPTSKADFLEDPGAFRIDPAALPPETGTLWKMIYTTGTTTGSPAPVAITAHDHFAYLFDIQRRQSFVGIGPGDVIANLFPLTPFPMGAYARAADEAAAFGASIFFTHTGRPAGGFPVHRRLDDAVQMIEANRATVLYGVAGFVRRILLRAGEVGADFSNVKLAMLTGEASSDAMREDMRRRMRELGCAGTRVINRYGGTELGSSLLECAPGSGFHCLSPDQIFHEVVDDATGARQPDGQAGMLAFTTLIRRGTVFLRYKMGDVVTLDRGVCPQCRRTSPRIVTAPVRSGDIVKIKGTLVNLQVLKDCIERIGDIHEYQIVVRRLDPADPHSTDELMIRLAVPQNARDKTAREIETEAIRATLVRPSFEFVDADAIFDPSAGTKPQRVIDLRNSPKD